LEGLTGEVIGKGPCSSKMVVVLTTADSKKGERGVYKGGDKPKTGQGNAIQGSGAGLYRTSSLFRVARDQLQERRKIMTSRKVTKPMKRTQTN